MLKTQVTQTPPKHEMTQPTTLLFPLPQEKKFMKGIFFKGKKYFSSVILGTLKKTLILFSIH